MKVTKRISLLLGILMVLTVVFSTGAVFAESPEIEGFTSGDEKDSYITVESGSEAVKIDYSTTRTGSGLNENTGKYHKSVIRGNIFLGYNNNEFGTKNISLKANKEFGFTLNGTTVGPGETQDFTLDLTKEHKITLNIPTDQEEYENYEEGSYVLKAGNITDNVKIEVKVKVDNVENWLNGNYGNNFTLPSEDPELKAYAENVVSGFNKLPSRCVKIIVPKGTNAMDVLNMYGQEHGMDIEGMDNNYVNKMRVRDYNYIGEFDITSMSGWMYTIEEDQGWFFPNVGAKDYTFTKDATMLWHFTLNYGSDIGAPWGSPDGTPGMPCNVNSPRLLATPRTVGDFIPQWNDAPRASELLVISK